MGCSWPGVFFIGARECNGLLEYKYRKIFELVLGLFVLYWVKLNNNCFIIRSLSFFLMNIFGKRSARAAFHES